MGQSKLWAVTGFVFLKNTSLLNQYPSWVQLTGGECGLFTLLGWGTIRVAAWMSEVFWGEDWGLYCRWWTNGVRASPPVFKVTPVWHWRSFSGHDVYMTLILQMSKNCWVLTGGAGSPRACGVVVWFLRCLSPYWTVYTTLAPFVFPFMTWSDLKPNLCWKDGTC